MSRYHSSGSASTAAAAMSVVPELERNWNSRRRHRDSPWSSWHDIVMRLLVLGAPSLLATPSLAPPSASGWEVTTFNRGLSEPM